MYLCHTKFIMLVMQRFVTTYWKTIICSVCILILSMASFSGNKLPTFTHADKLVHLVMYLTLTCILFYDYSQKHAVKTFRSYFLLLLAPIFYGGFMEIMQGVLTVSRSADGFDMLANSAGTLVGLVLSSTIYNVRR